MKILRNITIIITTATSFTLIAAFSTKESKQEAQKLNDKKVKNINEEKKKNKETTKKKKKKKKNKYKNKNIIKIKK